MASNDKYDRQLRLWGAGGQKALATAHICLLGAGATGTETLKNLVLPGVGRVTIVDGHIIDATDVASNFFVSEEHVGLPRAQVTQELVCELNPDVSGAHRVVDPATLIASEPEYFKQFSLVIATQLPGPLAARLCTACEAWKVPILFARTYGLLGTVRIWAPEHLVIESKPDNATPDLRVSDPFPELQALVDALDLPSLADVEFRHVPWVLLLIKFFQQWKTENGITRVATTAQKNAFKDFIKRQARDHDKDMNILEALQFVYTAWAPRHVEPSANDVYAEALDKVLTADTEPFWFVAKAVAEFQAAHGRLPVGSSVPDMTATSSRFIELQRVYRTKAAADRDAIAQRVASLVSELGLPSTHVSPDTLAAMCENAAYVACTRCRDLAAEFDSETAHKAELAEEVSGSESEQCPWLWYIALRAADQFWADTGRFPGVSDATLADDAEAVFAAQSTLAKALDLETALLSKKHAAEIVRYGACEPHNIAAVVGGIASQEAVKIVTRQFGLLNNTYLYNGITCDGASLEL